MPETEPENAPKKKKLYAFSEAEWIERSDYFFLTSRYMRYYTIIDAHPITKIGYYCFIFVPIVSFFTFCDIIIIAIKLAVLIVKFTAINLWEGLKWLFVHVWDLVGEAVLAFLKRMLSVLGVFVAGYAIYIFFKTGAYQRVFEFIMKLFNL